MTLAIALIKRNFSKLCHL